MRMAHYSPCGHWPLAVLACWSHGPMGSCLHRCSRRHLFSHRCQSARSAWVCSCRRRGETDGSNVFLFLFFDLVLLRFWSLSCSHSWPVSRVCFSPPHSAHECFWAGPSPSLSLQMLPLSAISPSTLDHTSRWPGAPVCCVGMVQTSDDDNGRRAAYILRRSELEHCGGLCHNGGSALQTSSS